MNTDPCLQVSICAPATPTVVPRKVSKGRRMKTRKMSTSSSSSSLALAQSPALLDMSGQVRELQAAARRHLEEQHPGQAELVWLLFREDITTHLQALTHHQVCVLQYNRYISRYGYTLLGSSYVLWLCSVVNAC